MDFSHWTEPAPVWLQYEFVPSRVGRVNPPPGKCHLPTDVTPPVHGEVPWPLWPNLQLSNIQDLWRPRIYIHSKRVWIWQKIAVCSVRSLVEWHNLTGNFSVVWPSRNYLKRSTPSRTIEVPLTRLINKNRNCFLSTNCKIFYVSILSTKTAFPEFLTLRRKNLYKPFVLKSKFSDKLIGLVSTLRSGPTRIDEKLDIKWIVLQWNSKK